MAQNAFRVNDYIDAFVQHINRETGEYVFGTYSFYILYLIWIS